MEKFSEFETKRFFKRGAIFDMDGTIIDTVRIQEEAWKNLFLRYGIKLTRQELKKQNGRTNESFIELILGSRKKTNLSTPFLVLEKDRILKEMISKKPPFAFRGVIEFLNFLKKQKVKLGLATSASEKTAKMLAGNLLEVFDERAFAEDVTNPKPDPEIFLRVCERLRLSPLECAVFEDSEAGFNAAKAGGFYCIAKDNNLSQNFSGVDFVLKAYTIAGLKKLFN